MCCLFYSKITLFVVVYLLFVVITGIPEPSQVPWPFMWHRGGGIIIPCRYIVFFKRQHIPDVRFRLQQAIEFIPGGFISQDYADDCR